MSHALRMSGIISSEEAAEILGCSTRYLRQKVSRHVRPVRIGRSIFWRKSDIETYKLEHPRIGQNRKTA